MHYNKAMSVVCFGKGITMPNKKGILKDELDYSNYTPSDWQRLWNTKAAENNIKYIPVPYKDSSVFKSLKKTFKGDEIKLMIDFIWDSGYIFNTKRGVIPKTDYGVYLMSSDWVNSIYNKAIWWRKDIKDASTRGWESTEKGSVTIDF